MEDPLLKSLGAEMDKRGLIKPAHARLVTTKPVHVPRRTRWPMIILASAVAGAIGTAGYHFYEQARQHRMRAELAWQRKVNEDKFLRALAESKPDTKVVTVTNQVVKLVAAAPVATPAPTPQGKRRPKVRAVEATVNDQAVTP